MANDFAGQYTAAASVDFQRRVSSALAAVAVQVYTEANPPANHPARAAYAVNVIANPPLGMVTINQFGIAEADKLVFAWARLLAAQGFDAASTDSSIQAQIATDWNAMAGA